MLTFTRKDIRALVRRAKNLAVRPQGNARPTPELVVSYPEYMEWEENRTFPVDTDKIRAFKDKHKGERCVLIGNGPSLNKTDIGRLKGECTFGVNGIFYMTDETGFAPTYLVVEDGFVVSDNIDRINSYQVSHKFFPSVYRDKIKKADNLSFFLMNRGFYENRGPNFRVPRFSMDCADKIYCGQTVTYINLQLAFYMGFKEVYLIGMDFTYTIPQSAVVTGYNILSTEDDSNHFHKDYFGKGKRWHDPQLDMVKRAYEYADLVYKWHDRKIYNATLGGKLEVFQRVDFDAVF